MSKILLKIKLYPDGGAHVTRYLQSGEIDLAEYTYPGHVEVTYHDPCGRCGADVTHAQPLRVKPATCRACAGIAPTLPTPPGDDALDLYTDMPAASPDPGEVARAMNAECADVVTVTLPRDTLGTLRELAADIARVEGYGFFLGGDPRAFHCDPECSTDVERAAHAADCAAWEAGTGTDRGAASTHTHSPDGALLTVATRAVYGLGSYVLHDPAMAAAVTILDAALGVPALHAPGPVPPAWCPECEGHDEHTPGCREAKRQAHAREVSHG